MSALDELLAELRGTCAGLADRRRSVDCTYTMADIGMAAFSLFFMQSPSFLAHQETLAAGSGRSNCLTLFGMEKIPTDNHIRQMLDGNAPEVFDRVFFKSLAVAEAGDGLKAFRRLGGRLLIALDGTEHYCSKKLHCPRCSQRKRSDGKLEYFHSFLGATVVAPGHARVLPLPPEFITPQDGTEKQDCENAAAKRWLARHGAALAGFRPVYLGDDLYARQPVAEAIRASCGNFILTCKPSSHKTVAEYLDGAELATHSEIVRQPGKKSAFIYRWLNDVPLRDGKDALIVNWFSVEIQDGKGKTTYRNSFVTDLPVSAGTVADLAACGRARWKIENETFNALKTGGYNLEHNFGHGKDTLANLLVTLNLLAFSFHAVAQIAVLAWSNAVTARGASYRFFEHLRTITAYVIFPDWHALLSAIANPKARPP
jgi:hypothetical protein